MEWCKRFILSTFVSHPNWLVCSMGVTTGIYWSTKRPYFMTCGVGIWCTDVQGHLLSSLQQRQICWNGGRHGNVDYAPYLPADACCQSHCWQVPLQAQMRTWGEKLIFLLIPPRSESCKRGIEYWVLSGPINTSRSWSVVQVVPLWHVVFWGIIHPNNGFLRVLCQTSGRFYMSYTWTRGVYRHISSSRVWTRTLFLRSLVLMDRSWPDKLQVQGDYSIITCLRNISTALWNDSNLGRSAGGVATLMSRHL
jgi:hypothetical protein